MQTWADFDTDMANSESGNGRIENIDHSDESMLSNESVVEEGKEKKSLCVETEQDPLMSDISAPEAAPNDAGELVVTVEAEVIQKVENTLNADRRAFGLVSIPTINEKELEDLLGREKGEKVVFEVSSEDGKTMVEGITETAKSEEKKIKKAKDAKVYEEEKSKDKSKDKSMEMAEPEKRKTEEKTNDKQKDTEFGKGNKEVTKKSKGTDLRDDEKLNNKKEKKTEGLEEVGRDDKKGKIKEYEKDTEGETNHRGKDKNEEREKKKEKKEKKSKKNSSERIQKKLNKIHAKIERILAKKEEYVQRLADALEKEQKEAGKIAAQGKAKQDGGVAHTQKLESSTTKSFNEQAGGATGQGISHRLEADQLIRPSSGRGSMNSTVASEADQEVTQSKNEQLDGKSSKVLEADTGAKASGDEQLDAVGLKPLAEIIAQETSLLGVNSEATVEAGGSHPISLNPCKEESEVDVEAGMADHAGLTGLEPKVVGLHTHAN